MENDEGTGRRGFMKLLGMVAGAAAAPPLAVLPLKPETEIAESVPAVALNIPATQYLGKLLEVMKAKDGLDNALWNSRKQNSQGDLSDSAIHGIIALREGNPTVILPRLKSDLVAHYERTIDGYKEYYKALQGFYASSEGAQELDAIKSRAETLSGFIFHDKDTDTLKAVGGEIYEKHLAMQDAILKELDRLQSQLGLPDRNALKSFITELNRYAVEDSSAVTCRDLDRVQDQHGSSARKMLESLMTPSPHRLTQYSPFTDRSEEKLYRKIHSDLQGYLTDTPKNRTSASEIQLYSEAYCQFADMVLSELTGKAGKPEYHRIVGNDARRSYKHHQLDIPNMFEQFGNKEQMVAYAVRNSTMSLSHIHWNKPGEPESYMTTRVPIPRGMNESEVATYFEKCATALGLPIPKGTREDLDRNGGKGRLAKVRPEMEALMDSDIREFTSHGHQVTSHGAEVAKQAAEAVAQELLMGFIGKQLADKGLSREDVRIALDPASLVQAATAQQETQHMGSEAAAVRALTQETPSPGMEIPTQRDSIAQTVERGPNSPLDHAQREPGAAGRGA